MLCAIALALVVGVAPSTGTASALPDEVTDDPLLNSRFVLFGDRLLRRKTLRWAAHRKNTDMVAPLIVALRFLGPNQRGEVVDALSKITGRRIGDDWFKWMQWQQANEHVRPFAGYDVFLSALFAGLDPGFKRFIYPGVASRIRLEEVVWGGVSAYDGIPALDRPAMMAADAADYLGDDEFVFGIAINGDVRAYPYRFMDWHEMLNDVVGGEAVTLAYCTLCGSGILYSTNRGAAPPFEFGSSGLLYRSNKLMYDRGSDSLWNQFTGEPVIGALADSGLRLETRPLVTATWAQWRARHPHTRVMSPDTGFDRPYEPGAAYGEYFRSGKLMFPALTGARALRQKDQVFGLRMSGANRAWPLKRFRGGRVLNDQVGVVGVVLIGDAKSRSVRAYRSDGHSFDKRDAALSTVEDANGGVWQVTEAALQGPDGERLTRLPGHLAFWFAWHNYLGDATLAR